MLMAVSLSDTIFAKLPNAWYASCPFLSFLGHIIELGASLITCVTHKKVFLLLYFAAWVFYVSYSLAQGYIDVGKTVFSSEGLR
jgi:hypothetical protein